MQEVNVKVAVRVRPLLPKEKLSGEQHCVRTAGNPNQLIFGSDRCFTYDHILFTKSHQEQVYKTCVEPLVLSIFDGYNATVFAYGQTGSGKTFTIGGGDISSLTEEEYGIIPRAIHHMFSAMKENGDRIFSIAVSYIEIYMEELRDLLSLDTPSKDMHVREDSKGNTVIVGAREVECETLDEVMSLLESGSAARHTGSTNMNEQSSRSHSIFTIVIGQKWSEMKSIAEKKSAASMDDGDSTDGEINHYMSGKFHFVDLAGSERAHKTGNIGDRFKESIHINSGLLSLGNVISALGDAKKRSSHIPYRESKITRLLKDSLGGNAKTLMICCISPASYNFDESLNSLKYANRARNIRNKPIINRDIQSIRFEEMQSEIKALRDELARQRSTVMSVYGDGDTEKNLQDANHIKALEDRISRLQTECASYRLIAEEAYKHILDIQDRDILSRSQNIRLKDWMELLEEMKNKVPISVSQEAMQNETIKSLQFELQKCRSHLESDETIFADKTREVNLLQEAIIELENKCAVTEMHLEETSQACQQQSEQLLAQQMRIEELEAALSMSKMQDSSIDATASLPTATSWSSHPGGHLASNKQRPKSVPAHIHGKDENLLRPPSRLIKTSPALFTLERVMQSFRARSQLLVSRLEDADDVLHQTFSDESNDEDENEKEENRLSSSSGMKNNRIKRRGTFQIKRQSASINSRVKGSVNDSRANNSNDYTDQNGGHVRSSTHLVEDMSPNVNNSSGGGRLINMDVQSSAEMQRKLIKQSQLRALEANQKIRDFAINIRMKEQLIKELVKSEKNAELMNKQYAEKIKGLEKEKEAAKRDLMDVQRALQSLETKDKTGATNLQKIELDYKKKIVDAKAKVSALQKRQKETEKVANFAHQHEKKIQDLEVAIDRMKQQQETMHKKLREEVDQKAKIERDMQREVQRVKDLEIRDEQTQKILKRKNEELVTAKRRLRSASSGVLPPISSEEQDKIEEQRKWVDSEVEKVLEQRRQNEDLDAELRKREAIVAKKEAIIIERSELEMKKMRSSQTLSKSILSLSSKLESVEKELEDKKRELPEATDEHRTQVKEDIQKLRQAREKLNKKRAALDAKLAEGKVLSLEDERRLIEMDEAVEALDAAIQYKNDTINSRQFEVRKSQQALLKSEENLAQRLNSLSAPEVKSLLSRYFDKVVGLRDGERKLHLKCSEMEVKTDEQERLIRELKAALQRAALELDRKLTSQQKDYEQKMQLLMHQITETGDQDTNGVDSPAIAIKIQTVEKELFYYKKKFRDARNKIRDLIKKGAISPAIAEEAGLVNSSVDVDAMTPRSSHNSNSGHNPLHREYIRDHSNPIPFTHAAGGPRPSSSSSGPPHQYRLNEQSQPPSTPVKISRRDLRQVSEEEIILRRSNASARSNNHTPRDSLEDSHGQNPWG